MAKSIRSKRERKFRAIKRKLNENIELERLEKCVTLHEQRLKQEEALATSIETDSTSPMPQDNDVPMMQPPTTSRHNKILHNPHKNETEDSKEKKLPKLRLP